MDYVFSLFLPFMICSVWHHQTRVNWIEKKNHRCNNEFIFLWKCRDLFRKRSCRKSKRRSCSPLGTACLSGNGATNPSTPISATPNDINECPTPPSSAQNRYSIENISYVHCDTGKFQLVYLSFFFVYRKNLVHAKFEERVHRQAWKWKDCWVECGHVIQNQKVVKIFTFFKWNC